MCIHIYSVRRYGKCRKIFVSVRLLYDNVACIKQKTENTYCATCEYTYTVYVGMVNGRKSSFSYHFCMTKLLVFSRGLKILTEVCTRTMFMYFCIVELFVLNRVHYTSAYTYCIVTIFSLPRNKKNCHTKVVHKRRLLTIPHIHVHCMGSYVYTYRMHYF